MLQCKIIIDENSGEETIVLISPSGDTQTFSSHQAARSWQYKQIFGENPSLEELDQIDRDYISFSFDLYNLHECKLVLANPCTLLNLQRIVNRLGIKVVVENYLVQPIF